MGAAIMVGGGGRAPRAERMRGRKGASSHVAKSRARTGLVIALGPFHEDEGRRDIQKLGLVQEGSIARAMPSRLCPRRRPAQSAKSGADIAESSDWPIGSGDADSGRLAITMRWVVAWWAMMVWASLPQDWRQ